MIQVPAAAGSSELRLDAAVNAANVLCSLAEQCEGQQEVLALLTQAVQLYRSALAQEEDAAVSQLWVHSVAHSAVEGICYGRCAVLPALGAQHRRHQRSTTVLCAVFRVISVDVEQPSGRPGGFG